MYRAFFALPKSIVDRRERPVNALLGTVNAMLAASEACGSRAVVACLGAEEAVYRVALYPGYHAHREPMPPALADQWKRSPALLESFGWTVSSSADLEADDVMASFARVEAQAGGRALLFTADRDLFQAVEERVAVLELRKDGKPVEIGPAEVRERYGVDPRLVPDFIALRGDSSDGLPGAPGVGAKTAGELLRRYGSLEAALAAAAEPAAVIRGELRPRVAAALREHDAQLRAFKQIAELVQVEVQRPADRMSDLRGGAASARKLGMRRLAERLEAAAKA